MTGRKTKLLALALAVLLTLGLWGCAPAQSPEPPGESGTASDRGSRSQASQPSPEEEAPGEEPEEVDGASSEASYHSPIRDRIKMQREQERAAQGESSGSSQAGESSKAPASSQSSSGSSKAPASSKPSSESSKAPAPSQSSSESSKAPAPSQSSSGSSKSGASQPEEKETLRVGPGLEDIARLAGLKAEVETTRYACTVDVDQGENPYDVTWDYGELYDAFVKEVDWDLLFDGDYYIRTFPGLAHLYHKDKDLLLRHFQTVGIHEGRQGCEGFNVAAYQKNCDEKVRKAFGDSYECYYFYYAMNQGTQKGVPATGSEKKQLTVELTNMQQTELTNINQYRAEVGAAPLEYDPELSALACYRAYVDALEDWDAHDWIKIDKNLGEIYGVMDLIAAKDWSENTVHGYPNSKDYAFKQGPATAWYLKYRYSEDHYKAMIDKTYRYVGCANCYISEYKKENPEHPGAAAVYVQFDIFLSGLTTPVHS